MAKYRSFFLFFLFISSVLQAQERVVGVYYYPGWGDSVKSATSFPWDKIKNYPERRPFLGWYDGDSMEVMESQVRKMQDYGINLVVFDWYWESGGVKHSVPINNFRELKFAKPKYSILWANHYDNFASLSDFDLMVNYWIDNYFFDKSIYLFKGNPAIFVFSPEGFERTANKIGLTAGKLIAHAQKIARARGVSGISWVAVSHAVDSFVNNYLVGAGYAMVTAYNYHHGLSGTFDPSLVYKQSHSFAELTDAYHKTWDWFSGKSKLPYLIPLTVGWDRRPWGGSSDPLHDLSYGVPEDFRRQLRFANDLLKRNEKSLVDGYIVCCWNEYGEGSMLEPTLMYGESFLEILRDYSGR